MALTLAKIRMQSLRHCNVRQKDYPQNVFQVLYKKRMYTDMTAGPGRTIFSVPLACSLAVGHVDERDRLKGG